VNGVDAIYTNIAGLAFTDKTQIRFDRTSWLGGAGININSAGLAQRISDAGVLLGVGNVHGVWRYPNNNR
jgi:hypothetical protein